MKIVCIGDSITYGQNVCADEAWPAVLARLTGHDVRNAGVCGDTTRLGLERFPKDVQLHRPDVVCIQFGHNDANCWETDNGLPRVDADAYASNIWEMKCRAEVFGATDVIILRPYVARGKDARYNHQLREHISALAGVGVSGINPPDVSLLDDGYGLHPDVVMHARFAYIVRDVLLA